MDRFDCKSMGRKSWEQMSNFPHYSLFPELCWFPCIADFSLLCSPASPGKKRPKFRAQMRVAAFHQYNSSLGTGKIRKWKCTDLSQKEERTTGSHGSICGFQAWPQLNCWKGLYQAPDFLRATHCKRKMNVLAPSPTCLPAFPCFPILLRKEGARVAGHTPMGWRWCSGAEDEGWLHLFTYSTSPWGGQISTCCLKDEDE